MSYSQRGLTEIINISAENMRVLMHVQEGFLNILLLNRNQPINLNEIVNMIYKYLS